MRDSTPTLRRRRRPITVAIAIVVTGLASGAPPAAAQEPAPAPWATINVCDTAARPDTIGIRASMPGTGAAGERLFARFVVQWQRTSDRRWLALGPTADSGFVALGGARRGVRREAGRDFTLTPPDAGQAYRLRGLVLFEWRRGDRVVRRDRRRTRAGHPGTRGADPAGFSAATCVVRGVASVPPPTPTTPALPPARG